MNTELPTSCVCYGLYDNDEIIAFCGVLHQPHNKVANIKRVARIVVLPDYQGIGIGTKFLETVGDIYIKQGYRFSIVTSAKNMIYALRKNAKWAMIRYSVNKSSTNEKAIDYKRDTIRNNCKTASFLYRGAKS